MRSRIVLASALAFVLAGGPVAHAAMSFQAPFAGYSWTELTFYGGAVDMAFLPNGDYLVARKDGRLELRAASNNAFRATVLDLRDQVNSVGDGGMMSVLLDPDFENTPYVYINYAVETEPGTPDTTLVKFSRISRFRLAAPNYLTVAPGFGEEIILGATWGEGLLQETAFHISGQMMWGTDGTLLVTMGDSHANPGAGGLANEGYGPGRFDPSLDIGGLRSQTLDNYNGKIIRIDRSTGLGLSSNPFYTGDPDDPQSRIWARGLREPWRMRNVPGTGSFDPADGRPGILLVGDVGGGEFEEIDVTSDHGGDNFGWPFWEADMPIVTPGSYVPPVPFVSYQDTKAPVLALSHSNTAHPSFPAPMATPFEMTCITAGVFYDHRTAHPTAPQPYSTILDDKFLFADWADLYAHKLVTATLGPTLTIDQLELMASGNIRTEAADEGIVNFTCNPANGKIYCLTYWRLYRLDYNPAGAPPICSVEADAVNGALPLTVNFDASGSIDPEGLPMTYTWAIDGGTPVPGTGATYQHTFTEDRNYVVTLTATNSEGRSGSLDTTIFAGNEPPQINLVQPTAVTKYPNDGTRAAVAYEAQVDDPDSTTPPAVLWTFDIATKNGANLHTADRRTDLSGMVTMGTFDQPSWYLVTLVATDSRGQSSTASVEVYEEGEGPQAAARDFWMLLE